MRHSTFACAEETAKEPTDCMDRTFVLTKVDNVDNPTRNAFCLSTAKIPADEQIPSSRNGPLVDRIAIDGRYATQDAKAIMLTMMTTSSPFLVSPRRLDGTASRRGLFASRHDPLPVVMHHAAEDEHTHHNTQICGRQDSARMVTVFTCFSSASVFLMVSLNLVSAADALSHFCSQRRLASYCFSRAWWRAPWPRRQRLPSFSDVHSLLQVILHSAPASLRARRTSGLDAARVKLSLRSCPIPSRRRSTLASTRCYRATRRLLLLIGR